LGVSTPTAKTKNWQQDLAPNSCAVIANKVGRGERVKQILDIMDRYTGEKYRRNWVANNRFPFSEDVGI